MALAGAVVVVLKCGEFRGWCCRIKGMGEKGAKVYIISVIGNKLGAPLEPIEPGWVVYQD